MKRILITGLNSYIGNQLVDWISKQKDEYQIQRISVRDNEWKGMDWSIYDTDLHVAGIAHNSNDASLEELYYQVNRDLTIEIAVKAKGGDVRHFVSISSIIIFGTKKEKN
ncbi:hypothetical protein [Aerococcus sp.]|uniref:hypothetical protein n=1 Tax=Aerococcus sp. TaxID=1872398 RepID=UPI0028AB10B6|nr:hypothetical protein [Aerococcus sp.]